MRLYCTDVYLVGERFAVKRRAKGEKRIKVDKGV